MDVGGKRCLKFWANFWEGVKDLDSEDRRSVLEAICAYAFDGQEPELKGAASAVFKAIKPLVKVYDGERAFAGSLGGSVGGEAKADSKIGNRNASKRKHRTQAKHKQNTSKTQAHIECECESECEYEGGMPPALDVDDLSEMTTDADRAIMVDGKVVGYEAPLTLEQLKSAVAFGRTSAPIPADYIETWYDDQERAGWVDSHDRAISSTQALRLLAANYRIEKKSPPRAVELVKAMPTAPSVEATAAVLAAEE